MRVDSSTFKTVVRLELVPLQHVKNLASSRKCNHFTYNGKELLVDKSILFEILDVHTVSHCSLLDTKNCQLMKTNIRCSSGRCQYSVRFMVDALAKNLVQQI